MNMNDQSEGNQKIPEDGAQVSFVVKRQKQQRFTPQEKSIQQQKESKEQILQFDNNCINTHKNKLEKQEEQRQEEQRQSPNQKDHGHFALQCRRLPKNNYDDMLNSTRDSNNVISVQEAIDRVGVGRFQYVVLVLVGSCYATDAIQKFLLLSFLSIVLEHEWGLSDNSTAFFTSSVFAGTVLGTLVFGPLADKIGRRPVFILAAFFISLFPIGTALSTNYWMLVASIFLVGIGVGGLTVPFDLAAELLPSTGRGFYMNLINYFWTFGCLYVIFLAYHTLGGTGDHNNNDDDHGRGLQQSSSSAEGNWRIFVALNTLPCLVSALIALFLVPESPHWLCSQGRQEEALQILRKIAKTNGHSGDEIDLILSEDTQLIGEEEEENAANCSELFKPKWLEITLRLWGVWLGMAFGYNGIIQATTRIFEHNTDHHHVDHNGATTTILDDDHANGTTSSLYFMLENPNNSTQNGDDDFFQSYSNGESSSTTTTGGDDDYSFDYGAIFINSAAELLGTTLIILFVDRWGRVPLQMVSYGLGGLCVGTLCVLSSMGGFHRDTLIFLGFMARVFEMTASCVTFTATAEILSTDIRTTGHAAANAIARIGAFISPFVVDDMPLFRIGLIMFCAHIFTVLCVMKLPETAGVAMGVNQSMEEYGEVLDHNGEEEEEEESQPREPLSLVNRQDGETTGELT